MKENSIPSKIGIKIRGLTDILFTKNKCSYDRNEISHKLNINLFLHL